MANAKKKAKKVECPRCGKREMDEVDGRNALSRRDNETYICSACGQAEALIDARIADVDDVERAWLAKLGIAQVVAVDKVGTLYPKLGEKDVDGKKVEHASLYMRFHGGTASADGMKWDWSHSGALLFIDSKQTGRHVTFNVSDLIDVAVRMGIEGTSPIVNQYAVEAKAEKSKDGKKRA